MVKKIAISNIAKKISIWTMFIAMLIIAIYLLDKDIFSMYISIHSYIHLNSSMNLHLYGYIVFLFSIAIMLATLFSEGKLTKKDFIVIPILTILFIESLTVCILIACILEKTYYSFF